MGQEHRFQQIGPEILRSTPVGIGAGRADFGLEVGGEVEVGPSVTSQLDPEGATMARPPKLSDEAFTAALADHPGSTAADLSKLLGVGQSTATTRLAALEATGAVRRTPGGRVDGVRAPDHWSVLRTADPPTAAAPAEETAPEEAVAEPAATGTVAEGPGSEARLGRLGRGALGALVRDYLAARPADAFGPAGLGKALGPSQGAISNALSAMAERREVFLVADKPRRYRIAS